MIRREHNCSVLNSMQCFISDSAIKCLKNKYNTAVHIIRKNANTTMDTKIITGKEIEIDGITEVTECNIVIYMIGGTKMT